MSQLDELLGQIPMSQLAQQVGASEQEVSQATESILPALFGGLQSNTADPAGAQSLLEALGQHSGGGLFDGPLDVGQVDAADGDKIVSHVFGDNREQVVNQLGGLGGAGGGLISKLLPLLAPIVMSFLAKKLGGALPGGLGDILGGGQGQGSPQPTPQQSAQQDPMGGLGDLLGSILGGRWRWRLRRAAAEPADTGSAAG